MHPSRLDYRSANLLIHQHDTEAELEAARLADLTLEHGDRDGQRVWMRIRRAVVELQAEAVGKAKLNQLRGVGGLRGWSMFPTGVGRIGLLSALVAGFVCSAINARAEEAGAAPLTVEVTNYPLTLKTFGPDVHVTVSGQLTCYPDRGESWDAKGEGTILGTIYEGSHASFTASARRTAKGRQVLMDLRAHDFMASLAMQLINKEASAPDLDRQAREHCSVALGRERLRK
jgi:hypothetical protein